MFDALEGPTVQRASIMFQRWKAIGQVNARRAILLVRRKAPSKTVLQFVYRSGQYALEDWSSRLRHALGIGKRFPIVRAIPFDTRLKLDLLDRFFPRALRLVCRAFHLTQWDRRKHDCHW